MKEHYKKHPPFMVRDWFGFCPEKKGCFPKLGTAKVGQRYNSHRTVVEHTTAQLRVNYGSTSAKCDLERDRKNLIEII